MRIKRNLFSIGLALKLLVQIEMVERVFNIGQINKLEDDEEYFKQLPSFQRIEIANNVVARLMDFLQGRIEPDFIRLISNLQSMKIEHLIVGGFAVVYHGHHRPIGDMDIWINPDKLYLMEALLRNFGLNENEILFVGDHIKNEDTIIQIGKPPHRIDLIINLSGIDFMHCYVRKCQVFLGTLPFDFIGRTELICMKAIGGREKDKFDLEKLEL